MLIVIRLFIQNIETGLGLPFSLTCLFLFYLDFILVHKREGKRQMFFRVRIEIGRIVGDVLSKLLLLEFPDVHLLVSVWIHFNSFWNFNPLFQWSACVHAMYSLLIQIQEVRWYTSSSILQRLFESWVASIRVWVSLQYNFFFFLTFVLFILLLHWLGSLCTLSFQAFPA